MEEIRAEKAEKFKELSNNRSSVEYQKWFLKYNPATEKKSVRVSVIKKPKRTLKKRPVRNSDYLF
jgi:hypothetical protein